MSNMPELKIGVVAVSRDCFPESLSVTRRENLIKAYKEKYGEADIYECPICIVESEIHMVQALEDIKNAGCNALVVYLGNFGPEIAVGDEIKFACVDGPEFDGHLVDFDQAMKRSQMYRSVEGRAMLKLQEGDTHHGGCGHCGGDE